MANRNSLQRNIHIIRALLAKDWRFFRLPMLALLITGAGCYALVSASMLFMQPGESSPQAISSGAGIAIALTAMIASAFGGMAIAGERADRTSDFMALLPVTRFQMLLSKWLVSLMLLGGSAMFHAFIAFYVLHLDQQTITIWSHGLTLSVGLTFSFFGIAWLFSSFTKSGPISACIAIAITLGSTVLVSLSFEGHNHSEFIVTMTTAATTAAIGMISLACGTVYYLRRIAP
jgi:ABC-type transport system involved in multi-copper enzyme maturation permease subunit